MRGVQYGSLLGGPEPAGELRDPNLPLPSHEQVSLLLRAWANGDEAALEKLTPSFMKSFAASPATT
jgi:hypothetical protein